jgi:hypothetical protein
MPERDAPHNQPDDSGLFRHAAASRLLNAYVWYFFYQGSRPVRKVQADQIYKFHWKQILGIALYPHAEQIYIFTSHKRIANS